jgi:hypothetical protein
MKSLLICSGFIEMLSSETELSTLNACKSSPGKASRSGPIDKLRHSLPKPGHSQMISGATLATQGNKVSQQFSTRFLKNMSSSASFPIHLRRTEVTLDQGL